MRVYIFLAIILVCYGWEVPNNIPKLVVCKAEEIEKRSAVELVDYLRRCTENGIKRVKRNGDKVEFLKRCGESIEELIEKKSADDIISFVTRCGTGLLEKRSEIEEEFVKRCGTVMNIGDLKKRSTDDVIEIIKRCGDSLLTKRSDVEVTLQRRCGTGVRELLAKRTLGEALDVLRRCGDDEMEEVILEKRDK